MNTETIITDNASQRHSYAGYIYNIGADKFKETTLQNLNAKHADLHKSGRIHIHDLDAYGITYNCLQADILQSFPFDTFKKYSYF